MKRLDKLFFYGSDNSITKPCMQCFKQSIVYNKNAQK